MLQEATVLSPQEARIESGEELGLATDEAKTMRSRIHRMLDGFRESSIHLNLDRARVMMASLGETEGQHLTLRWAKALARVLEEHPIEIGEEEILVGSAGPGRRYAIFYPETEGFFFSNAESFKPSRPGDSLVVSEEEARFIREEVYPFWAGRDYHSEFMRTLPPETRKMIEPLFLITPTATVRASLAWCHDFETVLRRGVSGIAAEARERAKTLDACNPADVVEKKAFLEAIQITCQAMIDFAHRYAALARQMAADERDGERKEELLEIAETCEWVPEHPSRTFREAVQSQWLTQIVSRLEQRIGGVVGNGRIDQYLYPYYERDRAAGRLTEDEALTLLESLWIGMARHVEIMGSPGNLSFTDGYAHWEATTIGGQTADGHDATNELSHLMLRSKREFPLNYPDLSARIHSRTPESFLHDVAQTIKQGTGFPKLFFDEEIIPLFLAKGATPAEANDYCVAGCTEVKVPNRDAYMNGCAWINLGAIVEMALRDGCLSMLGGERYGVATGDAAEMRTFDEFWAAFCRQAEHIMAHTFVQQYVADTLKPRFAAAPLASMLHDLCMEQCRDIHSGQLEGGLYLGSIDTLGFGTAVDSIAAVKKLVYDDEVLTMAELLEALNKGFARREDVRQLCLNAPKYGNDDPYVDGIGHDVEEVFCKLARDHKTAYGGQLDVRYVSVTSHIPLGTIVGATPDGRKACTPLSEGISPSQGADNKGPTATLASIASTRNGAYVERAARLLNMKLSPSSVADREGTKKLMALIRTACDLKTWHLQFNIVNRATLLAAKENPEKYRNLLVRVAGYSAYFVDLLPQLQDEIIARTEHSV